MQLNTLKKSSDKSIGHREPRSTDLLTPTVHSHYTQKQCTARRYPWGSSIPASDH